MKRNVEKANQYSFVANEWDDLRIYRIGFMLLRHTHKAINLIYTLNENC